MSKPTQITYEQYEAARQLGFATHAAHLPKDVQNGMMQAYTPMARKRDAKRDQFRQGIVAAARQNRR